MTQLVTRVDDDLVALVDRLIADGAAKSRSDAVRRGLRELVEQHQRRRTADAIVRGYREHPQTENEVGWTDKATINMINEEPW